MKYIYPELQPLVNSFSSYFGSSQVPSYPGWMPNTNPVLYQVFGRVFFNSLLQKEIQNYPTKCCISCGPLCSSNAWQRHWQHFSWLSQTSAVETFLRNANPKLKLWLQGAAPPCQPTQAHQYKLLHMAILFWSINTISFDNIMKTEIGCQSWHALKRWKVQLIHWVFRELRKGSSVRTIQCLRYYFPVFKHLPREMTQPHTELSVNVLTPTAR